MDFYLFLRLFIYIYIRFFILLFLFIIIIIIIIIVIMIAILLHNNTVFVFEKSIYTKVKFIIIYVYIPSNPVSFPQGSLRKKEYFEERSFLILFS